MKEKILQEPIREYVKKENKWIEERFDCSLKPKENPYFYGEPTASFEKHVDQLIEDYKNR